MHIFKLVEKFKSLFSYTAIRAPVHNGLRQMFTQIVLIHKLKKEELNLKYLKKDFGFLRLQGFPKIYMHNFVVQKNSREHFSEATFLYVENCR